ncbi:V-type ATP synthase subunit E [Enterococcus hirae]|nr:V-type ATP synthase subunit E [Enterococcus hirae]
MQAMENILKQIREKGEAAAFEYKTSHLKAIDEQFSKEVAALKKDEEDQLHKGLESIEKEYQHREQRQELVARQDALNRKQDYLSLIFKDAIAEMESFDAKQFQAFAEIALAQFKTNDLEVVLGEKSRPLLDEAWLKQFNQKNSTSFKLLAETVPHQGGLLLREGGIEYNFLFESLVKEIQEKESYKIANVLFQGK